MQMILLLLGALLAPSVLAQNGCLSENDIGAVPKTVRSDLYRGQQAFTVAMLKTIQEATPNENIFFSPYSTYHALLLAYFGARNHTEQELVEALRLQWAKNKNHVSHGYHMEKLLRAKRSKEMPLDFSSADKIYFNKDIKLTSCITDNFGDELESMDFRTKPEECRQEINNWIANITHDEIRDMLNPGDVDSDTQMVLANAAFFKGKWANQFDPKETSEYTEDSIFFTPGNITSYVKMMHKRGVFPMTTDERLGAYVLVMPYLTDLSDNKNSEISMIIVLPPFVESLETVLGKLSPESLELALEDTIPHEVDIWLPKFEFEQKLELVPILRKMGVNSLFDNTADLSAFSAETKLSFGDAKHVAKIKVDEEGSTAAAATVLFSFRSARPIEPTQFRCNHPFLFLIYDHTAKAVLFSGIYRDPKTRK